MYIKYGNVKFTQFVIQICCLLMMTVLLIFFALCSMNKILEKLGDGIKVSKFSI